MAEQRRRVSNCQCGECTSQCKDVCSSVCKPAKCTSPILTCRLNARFDCSTNSRHNQVPAKASLEIYGLCLRRHPCRHITSVLLTASEWCFMFLQVSAIDTCFREPVGRLQCSQIQGTMDEGKSSGPLGKAFFGT